MGESVLTYGLQSLKGINSPSYPSLRYYSTGRSLSGPESSLADAHAGSHGGDPGGSVHAHGASTVHPQLSPCSFSSSAVKAGQAVTRCSPLAKISSRY